MKKDTTPAGIVATGIEAAWENVAVSFERFCLTAGVATLAEMMERDAAKLCGPRRRRRQAPAWAAGRSDRERCRGASVAGQSGRPRT
jgi:hypothetical protein